MIVMRRSIFMAMIFSLFLAACGRNSAALPPANPEQLRLDCIHLLSQPEGEIASDKWARSITALKPLEVSRDADHIVITQQHEDGRFSRGYYVYADPQTIPPGKGVWIQKTEWKGIYIYKTQY